MTAKLEYTLHSKPPTDREYRRVAYARRHFYLADYGDISPNMLIDMFRRLMEVAGQDTLRWIIYDQNDFKIGHNSTLRMIMYDQNDFEIGRNVTEHTEYLDWTICSGHMHCEATHMATLLPSEAGIPQSIGEIAVHADTKEKYVHITTLPSSEAGILQNIGDIAVHADTKEKYEILAHLHHKDDKGTYFYAVRKVPDAAASENSPFIVELHPITELLRQSTERNP